MSTASEGISTHKLKERELNYLAVRDALTSVASREHFDQRMASEWSRAQNDRTVLSVILADVDDFKLFYNYYGYRAADVCLRHVAGALTRVCLSPGDLVARIRGAEFAAILPATDILCACDVAERMRRQIHYLGIHHEAGKKTKFLTASFGVATAAPLPSGNLTPDLLLKAAEQAVVFARTGGGNCVMHIGQINDQMPSSSWPTCRVPMSRNG